MIDDKINIYETFFGEGTEEEQLHMKELANKLNINHNDAIWTVIYVFNYFGRFYKDLPEQVENSAVKLLEHVKEAAAATAQKEVDATKNELAVAVVACADKIASKQSVISYLTLACMFSLGVFCLCLVSFVGGVAVAGKGWGSTPIDALLRVPAGWLLPIAVSPMAVFRGYHAFNAYHATSNKKELLWLVCCVSLIFISALMMLYVL